ncbi:MAG: HEPN domain-containing protein [Anaerolineae bacterium]
MNKEALRWLTQASDDLGTAQILFDSQRYGPCAFFCEQAAEKGLKAVLYLAGERPWGHSVSSLLEQVCVVLKIDPAGAPLAEAEALDEHYIRPRYPDARTDVEAGYDQETAHDALGDAQSVLAFVRKGVA